MPHLCRICTRTLANEKFSGRGHRDHVCRECQRLPRSTRESIDAESEIIGFFTDQSRISEKNIARLRFHGSSPDPNIVTLAGAVISVALVLPFRRKRFSKLRLNHPQLFRQLGKIGLVVSHDEPDCFGVPVLNKRHSSLTEAVEIEVGVQVDRTTLFEVVSPD